MKTLCEQFLEHNHCKRVNNLNLIATYTVILSNLLFTTQQYQRYYNRIRFKQALKYCNLIRIPIRKNWTKFIRYAGTTGAQFSVNSQNVRLSWHDDLEDSSSIG